MGASLLAKAAYHATLMAADITHSRAGSLPHNDFGNPSTLAQQKRHCLPRIKNAPYRLIRGISV
ncbi:hypothetical protein PspCFBP13508_24615 [Pseudomonas sp. CFBP13508]|nr:hypothetical protein PspCFBP13508_24615 [Pseudomonas sp. CFBP13508]